MGGTRTIQQTIQNLMNQNNDDTLFYVDAVVNSVDQDNRICNCTATSGKAANTFPNCRLMSDVDDGFLIIPTVGSTVTIILSSFVDPVVIAYSEIDQIVLRGGDLGGLPRVLDLVTKYNNLEKFCNNVHL